LWLSFSLFIPRLLLEEEEKMKALLALQEEQEQYILKTQREKQELRQEMVTKSQALEEAQHQPEKVRASRHRMDQDIAVSATKSVSNPDLLLNV
jgi:phage shock protein A